jgi:dienelactone hydrolase
MSLVEIGLASVLMICIIGCTLGVKEKIVTFRNFDDLGLVFNISSRISNPLRWISCAFVIAFSSNLYAQNNSFDRTGFEQLDIPGQKCTGFYKTPAWKCEPITIPAYIMKAPDRAALVLISHGSQGLDKRHGDYARQLVSNGISAVVLGHWEARGLGKIQFDYDKARRQGGDVPNQTLDVLAAITYFKTLSDWTEKKIGHMGESMGGGTAMALTRPYLRRAFNDLYSKPPAKLDALVALYAGCTERNTIESFLPIPLMFLHGEDDDNTLASDCQKQVPWMNNRGGRASITILADQLHDFDAPYPWARWRVENPAKCANLRDGDTFTLEVNGAKYPGTTEGYAQMRKDCIGMTWTGSMAGNKGNPKTGYLEWTAFLKKYLLE